MELICIGLEWKLQIIRKMIFILVLSENIK